MFLQLVFDTLLLTPMYREKIPSGILRFCCEVSIFWKLPWPFGVSTDHRGLAFPKAVYLILKWSLSESMPSEKPVYETDESHGLGLKGSVSLASGGPSPLKSVGIQWHGFQTVHYSTLRTGRLYKNWCFFFLWMRRCPIVNHGIVIPIPWGIIPMDHVDYHYGQSIWPVIPPLPYGSVYHFSKSRLLYCIFSWSSQCHKPELILYNISLFMGGELPQQV